MASPYIGEIRMFGGNFAPVGWMFCQGQIMAISENETLFNLIGTTYGGDGQSTFALPDLQSRVPVHMGNGFTLAQSGGQELVTLTVNQIPAHTHVPAASNAGNSDSPSNNFWAASANGKPYVNPNPTAPLTPPTLVPMNPSAIGSTGGSQPHDNMIPFLAVNFIISLFGTFPTQT
jgi:microcystin-dependent protein